MVLGIIIRYVVVVAAAYLLGGIPFALIIGLRFYDIDVRKHGSGNLGATNVFRALGAKAASATLLLDALKGSAAVGLAFFIFSGNSDLLREWAMIAATIAAVAGHSYSPYIKFSGGKGVATAAGALLVLTPAPWPFLLGTFVIVVVLSRMVSLGSVIIAVMYPLLCLFFYPGDWPLIGFSFGIASLVVWRHRTNIVRIARGEESKVSLSGRGSASRRKDTD
jgi:acyl phosphate:glycerol-3-phosphate acyltransferase